MEETTSGQPAMNGVAVSKAISRRELLKRAGTGVAAGLFSATVGKGAESWAGNQTDGSSMPVIEGASGKIPFSLIIDDAGPVDAMFYMHPGYETPLVVPLDFCNRVADTMERFDLRGKITILPMPSCLGRIDQSLKLVSKDHLEDFLKVVRERIAPRFDTTPEYLTHLNAYNLRTGDYQHIYEDAWISRAPIEEVVQYFTLAFSIHKNVGLNSTGITSPWVGGIDAEEKYTQALSEAQWQVFGRKLTWYFLYGGDWGPPLRCPVTYESPGRDRVVVSVPANFPDLFWSMDLPRDQRQQFIRGNIDRAISADGRTGRVGQLIESGYPVTLLTHWQSLYTQGTELGLQGLQALMERIQKVFGKDLEWVTCSERARRYVASTYTGSRAVRAVSLPA